MFKFSKIKAIYDRFLKTILFFSSFFIPFLFISAIFDLPETAFINSLLVMLVVLKLKEKANSKALEQIINVLGETITILGSLFVLLLFINSYLKLSFFLYEFYQLFWESFETLMNEFAISMVLIVILPILYFDVFARFMKFIIKNLKIKKEISVLLFLIMIMAPRLFTAEISEMISFFSVTLYQKLPWLFGFSLAFLHLNYLIKKGKELIKNKRGFTSIIIALIIFLIGGIFVLQYWWIPRKKVLEEIVESEEVIRNEIDGWEIYRNEEYGFEIKYPYYSTNVKYDIRFAEMLLPLEFGSRLFEKVFTVNIIEEEYDQPIDYYCIQGIPHAFITTFNEIDFCQSVSHEEVKEDLVVIRRFTYHTIHNKKWITLSLQLSYCLPRFSGDECSALAEFNESKEEENFIQMLSTLKFLD